MGPEISDSILSSIVEGILDEDTQGIALLGSYAREDTHPYSDLDIYRFMGASPQTEQEHYTLRVHSGVLTSFTTTTVSEQRMALTQPERAIWAVPGLRQARILVDRDGSLAELKSEAEAFEWEPLRAAADAYASYTLMGNSEEAHKALGGFYLHQEDRVLYGTLGLMLGMAKTMAVWRGVLIESENSYFRQVQEAAGDQSPWSIAFRMAAGFGKADVWERGKAGLRLYLETAELMDAVLCLQDRGIIDQTKEEIRKMLRTY